MSGQHTPGPWFVGAMNDCLFVLDRRPSSAGADVPPHLKADGPNVIAKLDYRKTDANARLIAAAPALLEALEGIVESDGARPGHVAFLSKEQIIARAKAAIARARGEQA